MNERNLTYKMSINGGKTWTEETISLPRPRTGNEYWLLMREIITELRGFESRFSTKILQIRHYWKNDINIEIASEGLIPSILKAKIGTYMDDQEITSLYPYVINDHMFFIESSKPIKNYDEFILTNIIQSKKGLEMTNGKLGSSKFLEKADSEIIKIERIKKGDFEFKWELWTKAYLLYEG
jgi:hypothetical protein